MQSGAFDYTGCAVAIRADVAVAHRDFWERLGKAGSWWTGTERVAIAHASRDALSCDTFGEDGKDVAVDEVEDINDHQHCKCGVRVGAADGRV